MLFTKMQGVGNDFVVIEQGDLASDELPALARKLCERRFSIGADGMLVLGKGTGAYAFAFRMFNPDGSEDMCGNGLRCACLWAYERGIVDIGEISVLTKDGLHECYLISAHEQTAIVRVNMGPPHLKAVDLPVAAAPETEFVGVPMDIHGVPLTSTIVNTGSTHSIIFLDQPVDEDLFLTVSPVFENLPLFPERTSVLWVWPLGPGKLFVRIWERGAGETLGCGTGACAVGVAAVLNGLVDRNASVIVASKGGELEIRWSDTIWMTGPAVLSYVGEVPLD